MPSIYIDEIADNIKKKTFITKVQQLTKHAILKRN